jgi:phospholipase C
MTIAVLVGSGVGLAVPHATRASPSPALVLSHLAFSDMVTSPVTSAAFSSVPGDAIVVAFDIFGKHTVRSVADSSSDNYVLVNRTVQTSGSRTHQLVLYAAWDVKGGSTTRVTVQTTATDAAVLVVDVSGVAPRQPDFVGRTSLGVDSSSATSSVTANAGDLVLGFVASSGWLNWVPESPTTTLNTISTPSKTASQTAADFVQSASFGGTATLTANASRPTRWVAEALALKGAGPPPVEYPVEFVEDGLPNGTAWSADLNGTNASSSNTSASFEAPNGTYAFSATATGFLTVLGEVNVTGAPVRVNVSFLPGPPEYCGRNVGPFLNQFCRYVDHVVIIFMENHPFDNYFGTYPGVDGIPNGTCVPYNPSNLSQGCATPFDFSEAQAAAPTEMPHGYAPTVEAIDGGRMDGFYLAEGKKVAPFGHYNGSTIPVYWDMAQEFGLGDDFFSSSLSYSLPNHWYLMAGQYPDSAALPKSPGYKSQNTLATVAEQHAYLNASNQTESVQDLLNATPNVGWKYYDWPLVNYSAAINRPVAANDNGSAYADWSPLAAKSESYSSWYSSHFVPRTEFFQDVNGPQFPNVSWVIPDANFSDHPPANLSLGEAFVSSCVDAIENSSYWNSTAIFVTWDDYGGFYDHVAPPIVNPFGLSFRVPLLVFSPYTPAGSIVHGLGYFESLLRLVEDRFLGGACITARDCSAPLPEGYFNFSMAPRAPVFFTLGESYPMTDPAATLPVIETAWTGSDAGLTEDEAD